MPLKGSVIEGSGYSPGFHGEGTSGHGDRVSGQGWPRINGKTQGLGQCSVLFQGVCLDTNQ